MPSVVQSRITLKRYALLTFNLAIAIHSIAVAIVQIVEVIAMRDCDNFMPVVNDCANRLAERSENLTSAHSILCFDCAVHVSILHWFVLGRVHNGISYAVIAVRESDISNVPISEAAIDRVIGHLAMDAIDVALRATLALG